MQCSAPQGCRVRPKKNPAALCSFAHFGHIRQMLSLCKRNKTLLPVAHVHTLWRIEISHMITTLHTLTLSLLAAFSLVSSSDAKVFIDFTSTSSSLEAACEATWEAGCNATEPVSASMLQTVSNAGVYVMLDWQVRRGRKMAFTWFFLQVY